MGVAGEPVATVHRATGASSRSQVSSNVRRRRIRWSRSGCDAHAPAGSQPIVRLTDGSSTATQPLRRMRIGTVTGTPLIDGGRNARGLPPGASYTASGAVGCRPSVSAAVDEGAGSAGNPFGTDQ
ncbi:hypothetical protein KRM28CT15_40380 [Krasilnikovia sp. M28-CT-15]